MKTLEQTLIEEKAPERVIALLKFLGHKTKEEAKTCKIDSYDPNYIICGDHEYYVCTDEEANELTVDNMNNILEDNVLIEMPEKYRKYFDVESWRNDYLAEFGRGKVNAFNDKEETVEVAGTIYFIYQQK